MPVATFIMSLENLDVEAVEAALFALGAQSVTLLSEDDEEILEPLPGQTPLWNRTRLSAVFEDDVDREELCAHLRKALATETLPANELRRLEDKVWEREWLRYFGPMRFGKRLWVSPRGQRKNRSGEVTVWLDPGLAFGTGTHPTTALCLEWLESQDLGGQIVVDYGCGSGILAIAALKLGARCSFAIDIDPQALAATRENAVRNAVAARLIATPAPGPADVKCDILLANILAGTLGELADTIARLTNTGGSAILSGILENQVNEVAAAYADDFVVVGSETRDGWAALVCRRR
jgi:ribosomal protein L11 methyltransferase